ASVGLANWSGTAVPGLYQSEVMAVNGVAVASTRDVYARVAALPAGTPVRYRLARQGVERDVMVVAQRFTPRDWLLLFGAFLTNGAVILLSGLIAWVLRPRASVARAFLMLGVTMGLFFLTAMDLYGPATFASSSPADWSGSTYVERRTSAVSGYVWSRSASSPASADPDRSC